MRYCISRHAFSESPKETDQFTDLKSQKAKIKGDSSWDSGVTSISNVGRRATRLAKMTEKMDPKIKKVKMQKSKLSGVLKGISKIDPQN